MLQTQDFMNYIQNALNNTTNNNVVFRLFDNAGNYEIAKRNGNSVDSKVLGIFSLLPSTLIPIVNLQISNISARLEIEIDIDRQQQEFDNNEILYYPEVREIIGIWNDFAQQNNGIPFVLQDSDNISYSITPTYSLANVGIIEMSSSDTGEILPIVCSMTFSIIENGINSNDIQVEINGQRIFYNDLKITRNRVADAYQLKNGDSTKSAILQNGIGVDLILPMLRTRIIDSTTSTENIYGEIADDILNCKQNKGYLITLRGFYGPNINSYLMTTGTDLLTAQPATNAGVNISFVEVLDSIVNFYNDSRFEKIIFTASENSMTATVEAPFPKGSCILWGETIDGIKQITFYDTDITINATHTYSQVGTYTIIVFKNLYQVNGANNNNA